MTDKNYTYEIDPTKRVADAAEKIAQEMAKQTTLLKELKRLLDNGK